MGTEVLKIYIVLGILLVVILAVGFYYVFNESIPDLPSETNTSDIFQPDAPLQNNQTSTLPKGLLSDIEDLARAKIKIVTSGKNKIIVSWENLPDGTNRIVIFRSNKSGVWTRWNSIAVGSSGGGSAVITLRAGENAGSYSYYAQAFSPNGYTLWASPVTQAEPPAPPQTGSATSTATTTAAAPPSGNQNPPPAAAPSSSPTSTTPTTPPPTGGSTSTATSTVPVPSGPPVAYYTPSGEISGYYYPQLDPFFVMHINENIEISWQNLPPPTETIVVYRSLSQTGPWKELMRQDHPSTVTRDFVRLIDYTIHESFYYRMDALSESGAVLAAYEPIYLPGIGQ